MPPSERDLKLHPDYETIVAEYQGETQRAIRENDDLIRERAELQRDRKLLALERRIEGEQAARAARETALEAAKRDHPQVPAVAYEHLQDPGQIAAVVKQISESMPAPPQAGVPAGGAPSPAGPGWQPPTGGAPAPTPNRVLAYQNNEVRRMVNKDAGGNTIEGAEAVRLFKKSVFRAGIMRNMLQYGGQWMPGVPQAVRDAIDHSEPV